MQELKKAVEALTDDAFSDFYSWVTVDERDRRRAAPYQADIIAELRESGELEAPKTAVIEQDKELAVDDVPPWENPGTLHSKMYTFGAVVSHKARIWRSEHRGLNHWEPGAQGIDERIWRDITDEVTGKAADDTNADDTDAGDTDASTPGAAQDGAIPFKAGLNLKAGDVVVHQGAKYKVLQPHTSQSNWTPDAVPALFSRL